MDLPPFPSPNPACRQECGGVTLLSEDPCSAPLYILPFFNSPIVPSLSAPFLETFFLANLTHSQASMITFMITTGSSHLGFDIIAKSILMCLSMSGTTIHTIVQTETSVTLYLALFIAFHSKSIAKHGVFYFWDSSFF